MDIPDVSRLALSYAMSFLAYRTGRGPRPFSAAMAVTNRCNLRCVYCNTPYMDPKDLTFDQSLTVMDRLKDLGVSRLGIVGGEPLIKKDIGELVKEAKQRGFYITFNSNLTQYHRKPEVFEDVDLVFTSLDGDAETHQAHRGAKSYDGVLEAIDDLVARGLPVVAICVVGEANAEQAEGLIQQAERGGFKIHFQPQCLDTEIVRGELDASVRSEDLRKFWAGLVEQKKAGRPLASSAAYLKAQASWDDFRVSAYTSPGVKCAAGRGFLYVDPQGFAYPCAFTKGQTPGINLLEEDWRTAFSGETPCNVCNVGPMMEFNLLFDKPLSASLEALSRIA